MLCGRLATTAIDNGGVVPLAVQNVHCPRVLWRFENCERSREFRKVTDMGFNDWTGTRKLMLNVFIQTFTRRYVETLLQYTTAR